jgi:hypothetical protein
MFLKDATGTLVMLDMSSEDISWTQNVAQLGRFFNGALYCPYSRTFTLHSSAKLHKITMCY